MDHEPKNGPIDVYVSDFGLAYHVLRKPTWWRKLWAATVGRIWWTWKLRRLFRQALREAVVEVAPAANRRVSGFAGIAKEG